VLDENGERKNPASDIIIGNHVWIVTNCSINKGVSIGDNSIIAGHSVLTKSVPGEVIAAGVPAKIVKIGYS
jgi:acetyltransferase-like isoleucine patch superfamily enzyme